MPDQFPEEHPLLPSGTAGAPRLGDGRDELGDAFADPNSKDDGRIGRSFIESNSNGHKHRKRSSQHAAPAPESRRTLLWFIVAAVILFAIVVVAGWIPRHRRDEETRRRAKEEQDAKPEIQAIHVRRAGEAEGLVVPGTTTPYTEAPIYARANGYLKRRFVDIGDHVHKGQLLAIIDAPDLDQQVDQAREQVRQSEAQLAQQETQLALTKVTVDRYRELVRRGVFSRQDGDQREADYQAQRANVASAERNVEAFKANLRRVVALQSYERVTSPFDGVITQRNVDTGALISAQGSAGTPPPVMATSQISGSQLQNGATNTAGAGGSGNNLATPATGGSQGGALFSVAQSGRLRVLVSVPEGYAGDVHLGEPAALHFQEFAGHAFAGTVTRTAAAIDQNTRTLLTEVQIDNTSGRLIPGMYAVVTFAPVHGAGPLVVPGDAIAIRNDEPTVAVVRDGRVHLAPVVIGRDLGPVVEISSGVQEGDLIASTFTDDVQDNVPVNVRVDQQQEQKTRTNPALKPTPPGGSTQYSDPGITDANLQGQIGKQEKQSGGKKGGAQ